MKTDSLITLIELKKEHRKIYWTYFLMDAWRLIIALAVFVFIRSFC